MNAAVIHLVKSVQTSRIGVAPQRFALLLAFHNTAQIRDPAPHETDKVEIQMRGVDLRAEPDVVLEIRSLREQLERTDASKPVTFDDSNSFALDVQSGEIAIGRSGALP